MNNKQTCTFLVCGAGFVGMTLAIALKKLGYSLIVLDPSFPKSTKFTNLSKDHRGICLSLSSINLLKHIGVWQDLIPFAEPITKMHVYTQKPTTQSIQSQQALHFQHHDPYIACIIEGSVLKSVLTEHMIKKNVLVIRDKIESIVENNQHAVVQLHKKTKITASWCLVAEGAESTTRVLADFSVMRHPYNQRASITILKPKTPHKNTAWDMFYPSGTFSCLPMTNGRINIVDCHEHKKDPKELMQSIYAKIPEHFTPFTCETEPMDYPLSMILAYKYQQGRFVLVGDCAHSNHPLAGQGLNLGLRDVSIILEHVLDLQFMGSMGSNPVPKDFAFYENLRFHDNIQMSFFFTGINAYFKNHGFFATKSLYKLGELGFKFINKTPLKPYFLNMAMGISKNTSLLMNNKDSMSSLNQEKLDMFQRAMQGDTQTSQTL